MITITTKENEIKIQGHSGYAEHGKDIVCASISCIAITTINAIESISKGVINASSNGLSGYLEIKILKKDDIVDKLIQNMLNMFDEVISQYPKYVERR